MAILSQKTRYYHYFKNWTRLAMVITPRNGISKDIGFNFEIVVFVSQQRININIYIYIYIYIIIKGHVNECRTALVKNSF